MNRNRLLLVAFGLVALAFVVIIFWVVSCAPNSSFVPPAPITRAPSLTPSATIPPTATATPTFAPSLTPTATQTNSPSITPIPTIKAGRKTLPQTGASSEEIARWRHWWKRN